MRTRLILSIAAAFIFFSPALASACTLITGANQPDGWGAAHNVFSSAGELILRADCTLDSFTPEIGSSLTGASNFAVYTTGYYYDGSSWVEMSYSPAGGDAEQFGSWILGDAAATESIEYQGDNTFFAAYTCHWDGSGWNCGCQDEGCDTPAWQLQAVDNPAPDEPGFGPGAPLEGCITDDEFPADSVRVGTPAELQAALDRGEDDITLTESGTVSQIFMPRSDELTTVRFADGVVLYGDGSTFPILTYRNVPGGGTPRSGRARFVNVRIDGQVNYGRNSGGRTGANIFMPRYDYFSFECGMVVRSRNNSIASSDNGETYVYNSLLAWNPKDTVWMKRNPDLVLEGNIMMHSDDDGISTHIDTEEVARSVIIRNNIVYDTLGIKVLGGALDGTVNGKPSQVLIEGNQVYLTGFYGIFLGADASFGEGLTPQRNITVRNNLVENVRNCTPDRPCRGGHYLNFNGDDFPLINVTIEDNIFRRTASDGQTYAEAYGGDYPAPLRERLNSLNIPDEYKQLPIGAYGRTIVPEGIDTGFEVTLADDPWRIEASNPGVVSLSDNIVEGF